LLWLGEVVPARAHLQQGIALYDPQEHRALAFRAGIDLAVWCLSHAAQALRTGVNSYTQGQSVLGYERIEARGFQGSLAPRGHRRQVKGVNC